MSLINYDPWRDFRALQSDINRLFTTAQSRDSSSATADWAPAVDIDEFDGEFRLFVDLPGVDPEAVEITLEDGVLTISGERFRQAGKADETVVHRRSERASGRFYRRFILPDTVDAERVEAAQRNGVFEITIPKVPKAQPRRIKVAA